MTMDPEPAGPAAEWKHQDVRHHDAEAPFYDRLIGREYAPYQQTHTSEVWARLLGDGNVSVVLDVGAGTGSTTLPVARAGIGVIAVDTSPGMLRVLRAKAAAAGLGRVWPVIGDAERLPLARGAVGGVTCQGVLHHLPDVTAALTEADRVLAPGGWLCLAEPDSAGSVLATAIRRTAAIVRPLVAHLGGRRSPATDNERPLDATALCDDLTGRGYTLVTAHLVHPPFIYRYLPRIASRAVSMWLNGARSARRRRADMCVIRGRKPVSPGGRGERARSPRGGG
jgi:ubiquinone/menaquinone biosynthesis C-methylase UbiE